jgi:sulfatase modifying factor 1
MIRSMSLNAVVLVVAAVMVARADEPARPKVLATASEPDRALVRLDKDDSGIVIRSRDELVARAGTPAAGKTIEADLAKLLNVAGIDWEKQMVLAVRGRPTNGELGIVKFDPPTVAGKTLRVAWKQENHVIRAPHLGPPIGFALVERFAGPVTLVPWRMDNSVGMTLMRIPAGKFVMGSAKGEEDRLDEEVPHEVELTRAFYMGKHEVTVGQFRMFVRATGYRTEAERDGTGGRAFDGKEFVQKPEFTWKSLHFTQADDHPAVVLSWNDAVAFCAWLSKAEGRTCRLPTETEWEYACRAESTTRFHAGDRDADLKAVGNIADAALRRVWPDAFWAVKWDDGHPYTAPVGSFRANDFGLCDMHGNAWEWCADWYGEGYYAKSPRRDPPGPAEGKLRVARGGAWSTQPKFCRSAFRDWHEPTYRSDCVGFRVVAEEGTGR